jgi:5-methylcytosine-specific restriction endonuclease McrA
VPTVPNSPICSMLGCKNARSKVTSLCLEHGGMTNRIHKGKRGTDSATDGLLYQTAFWKRKRILQLSTQPLCQACLLDGIVAQAVAVDHVFPWRVIRAHSFYINLFQSLCTSCHSTKTAYEQAHIYMYYANDGVQRLCKTDYMTKINELC